MAVKKYVLLIITSCAYPLMGMSEDNVKKALDLCELNRPFKFDFELYMALDDRPFWSPGMQDMDEIRRNMDEIRRKVRRTICINAIVRELDRKKSEKEIFNVNEINAYIQKEKGIDTAEAKFDFLFNVALEVKKIEEDEENSVGCNYQWGADRIKDDAKYVSCINFAVQGFTQQDKFFESFDKSCSCLETLKWEVFRIAHEMIRMRYYSVDHF
ncbi:MAG TPA: hypothetical protein VEK38_03185 [Candidatus Bathyarchaeia archaeon]|nr:hypothetical protein [Candidatus Bathyarchaeia archaeon]